MNAAPYPKTPGLRRVARRWRILGGISLAGAVGALVATLAFGALSATGVGTGSASTGGVVLTLNGPPATFVCTVGPMTPGDASTGWTPTGSDPPCTFSVTYSGSLPAFIGVYFSYTPTSGGLYDTTANGLQFQITDGSGNTYTTGGMLNASGASAANPLLVASDAASPPNTVHALTVNYALPRLYNSSPDTQDNNYQKLTTNLTITVEAVQSQGNGYATKDGTSGGTPCTPGQRCAGISAWS